MSRERNGRRAAERKRQKEAKKDGPSNQPTEIKTADAGFWSRRNILRFLGVGLATLGLVETIRRNIAPSEAEDSETPILSLLKDLIKDGHKRIYFSDKHHWAPENIGFFANEVIPAFKKALPSGVMA